MVWFYHTFGDIETRIHKLDLEHWSCTCVFGSVYRYKKGMETTKCIHYMFAIKRYAQEKIDEWQNNKNNQI